jgi:hypothetical protein
VPSTNTAPPLRLTFRRAERIAFWLLAAALLDVVVWVLAVLVGAQRPWMWGAVAAVGALAAGSLTSNYFDLGIRAWNKLMRVLTPVLRVYVLRVMYFVLIVVGLTASSFHVAPPGVRRSAPPGVRRSMWVLRNDGVPGAGQREAGLEEAPSYRAAAGRVPWIVFMLPAVALVKVLRDKELTGNTPPSATYTLY